MDQAHSLLLNEAALQARPDLSKPAFIYEWLRYLDKILPVTLKADLKQIQPILIKQLESRLVGTEKNGPPTRKLLSRCIARVYATGDQFMLFGTINTLNDTLKSKDDQYAKLTALSCLAALYEQLGRTVGRTYEESFTIMAKWMKSAESQYRTEILNTMSSMLTGLGASVSNIHKDMYKLVIGFTHDRSPSARVAAIECLTCLIPLYPPIYVEHSMAVRLLAIKALTDDCTYEIRLAVARLYAVLISTALEPPPGALTGGKSHTPGVPVRPISVDDGLQQLAPAFIRGSAGTSFLKGTPSSRDVRVGVAMGYVELVREMGATWLEKNLAVFCKHVMDLAGKCGSLADTTNPAQAADAVLMRRCLSYILRATVGGMLSEQAQITACKHLGALLAEYINSFDYSVDPGVELVLSSEAYSSAHAASVALLELSALARQIGTAVTPIFVEASGIMEPIFACVLHPIASARVATAWCLRSVTLAVPSQLTPLIDRCISRLDKMKASGDAINGYSLALAALVASSADCKLGIPHGKPKQVLQCAEDLLKTATQVTRLTISKNNAGWTLMNAVVSLGPVAVRDYMPKLCKLWTATFPRSVDEARAEENRGDLFTWQCFLESRAGALSVMAAAASQRELVSDDVIRSMLIPIETSIVTMSLIGTLIRKYGQKLRPLICTLRIRVYRLLMVMPPKVYDTMNVALLRELVADLTMSDNIASVQVSSIVTQICSGAESVLIRPWLQATDQWMAEDPLQSPSGSMATLENDPICVNSASARNLHDVWPEEDHQQAVVLDLAIQAYSKVFSMVNNKHRQQITDHFTKTIRDCKPPARKLAIQQNVICAMALAFRSITDQRGAPIPEPLRTSSYGIIIEGLNAASHVTRCVSAEALGRLAKATGDLNFVALLASTFSNDVANKNKDSNLRSGCALALGCIHRHVSSMNLGGAEQLNKAVHELLRLAQETSQSQQAWSLVSLSLMAEKGGALFRPYVEPMLLACHRLLLHSPASHVDVALGVGKLMSALMTCLGPELGLTGTIDVARESRETLLAACAIQLSHSGPLVRSEAIAGLQQMHLYAPRQVDLAHLVHNIAVSLTSPHLCVRRAAVCCLKQLVQREAVQVREHAQVLVPEGVVDASRKLPLPETGLEGALFAMLDTETHPQLRLDLEDTLTSLVQATGGDLLGHWLSLCKDILATTSDAARSTMVVEEKGGADDDDEEGEGGSDDVGLQGARVATNDKGKLYPRWPTRVFATQVVQRLMSVCDTQRAHLDLTLAKELQNAHNGDFLVLHLSDLVRMSFMGATSEHTELRLAGLQSLQEVINRFSAVPEPEFPGHVILEQFQAQVGAALRPAFADETPSHVTAAACQVCSTWIGSGVARDLNDLRRVHQLLVSSLGKLEHGSINTQLYSEAAATLEKLAILKAWAEVYVTAVQQEQHAKDTPRDDDEHSEHGNESLLSLVGPELTSLAGYWLAALHDAATLSLPSKYADQLPPAGGAFYKSQSAEVCREYYRSCWPPLLLASSMWLRHNSFQLPTTSKAPQVWLDDSPVSRFHVMMGLAVEALCTNKTHYSDDVTIQMCLRAIGCLLACEWCQTQLMMDVSLPIELCNVLHRLILTRDNLATQQLCVDCAHAVLDAAMVAVRTGSQDDVDNGNAPAAPVCLSSFRGDEGAVDGQIAAGSLTYAMVELCLCVFIRQMPQINSAQMKSRSTLPLHLRRFGRLTPDSAHLIRSGIQLMVQLPSLCSSPARLSLLPVLLYLLIGFVRESARIDATSVVPELPTGHLTLVATTALQALRTLASSAPSDATLPQWTAIMRSALYSILVLSDNSACPMDECVLMLSSVVVAAAAPRSVVVGHSETTNRLVRLLRQQLNSDNPHVVCKTLQSLSSLFARREVSSVFRRHLGGAVVDIIRTYVTGDEAETACKSITDDQLAVVQEAIKAIEILAASAEDKKLPLVSLLSQSLSRLLVAFSAEGWRQLEPAAKRLHEWALARLGALAPVWPAEFKAVLSSQPSLKARLESALLLQASRQSQANAAARSKMETRPTTTTVQPTIRLTMDFNAFQKA